MAESSDGSSVQLAACSVQLAVWQHAKSRPQADNSGDLTGEKRYRTPVRDYRNLIAWQRAHALALEVYRLTVSFPASERLGMSSQLRRAAASIGAHKAEGCGRASPPDLNRFLSIASGSASELQNHLELSRDLGYLPDDAPDEVSRKAHEVKRLLYGPVSSQTNIE